jgi:mRNA interferase RelE/StbE
MRVARQRVRTADKIVYVVRAFAMEQRGDVKKLQGSDLLRLRVGDWRIFLKAKSGEIEVVEVTDRQDAYD